MDEINYTGDGRQPEIILSSHENKFTIQGIAVPDHLDGIYSQVLAWLDNYCGEPNPETNFIFYMKYFNAPSSKFFLDIMTRLEVLSKQGKQVCVTWMYDANNPEMREAGEEYEAIVELPFQKICVN